MLASWARCAAPALTAGVGLALIALPVSGNAGTSVATPARQQDVETVAATHAREAVAAHPDAALFGEHEELHVVDVMVDGDGSTHVRFRRTYRGLPVIGGHLIVHQTPSGELRDMTVNMGEPIEGSIEPGIGAAQATSIAYERFEGNIAAAAPPRLVIDVADNARLAWEVVMTGTRGETTTPSELHVLVGAQTGDVVDEWNEVYTAEGVGDGHHSGRVTLHTTPTTSGGYAMRDPRYAGAVTLNMFHLGGQGEIPTGDDNQWDDGAAVDAHYGAAQAYTYYARTHEWDGIDGDGQGVRSRVHFADELAGAFYSEGTVSYGDGPGNQHPFTALEIIGHEITHGVTENTAGLRYSGDAGGLNESTSDVFGTLIEFTSDNPEDPPDYTVGEKLDLFEGGALRYMYDPKVDGESDSCYGTGTRDKDPHYASGVGNHFFYLLARGSASTDWPDSPTCDGSAVAGIGNVKAGSIWFRALTRYMGPTETYPQAAKATLSAAVDLYGCDTAYQAVRAAWPAAGVDVGEDSSCAAP